MAAVGTFETSKSNNPREDLRLHFTSTKEMADYIKNSGNVDLVDAVFCDPIGLWHHCTFAPSQCDEDDLRFGFAFDGSSIKLFKSIEESDMVMVPDVTTCWMDPFYDRKVLHVTCHISTPNRDPQDGFSRCPRSICKRAIEYMKASGIADTAYFGPEPEFFIFDDVKISTAPHKMGFEIDFEGAHWNADKPTTESSLCKPSLTLRGNNLAHRVGAKQNYFPVAPIDRTFNLRGEMLLTMERVGLPIEKHHLEVASGQQELGITCRTMLESADHVMTYKYIVKNEAARHGKTATFMPKPLIGDNGSGMHVHQSLWKDGVNLFFDPSPDAYCHLSPMALHYTAGILHHAPALLAITSPTTNSYKRLVPGFEAPTNLVYAKGNRSAAVRIPLFRGDVPKAKRIEFRCPDPLCNPYLAYAAMLLAGLDGIKKKMVPAPPCDNVDIYHLSAEERAARNIRSTPGSLQEAVEALEKDHAFLTEGGVFTEDFIHAYCAYRKFEALGVSLVPNPKEFELYYAA